MKFGLFPVIASAALSASCTDMCGNELVSESIAPDGQNKLVVFVRDCGATTGFSTQASVLPTGEALPNDSGNILVIDGMTDVRSGWLSNSQLLISGINSARVFKQESRMGRSGSKLLR